MHAQNTDKRPPLDAWLAEQLRLTALPIPPFETRDLSWWEELMGEPAETQTRQPGKGLLKEEGLWGPGRLRLEAQPLRIDWIFSRDLNREAESDQFPMIGPFLEVFEPFIELMSRWLQKCPPIRRLAFAATLDLPVQNRQEGYRFLQTYLPNIRELDSENALDFLYQINRLRRSTSGIAGLKINRLCKWSVVVLEKQLQSDGNSVTIQEQHFCHLEMDINTSSTYTDALPHERLPDLFQELARFGKEIAQEGDIP